MSIGERIKSKRLELGLSQEALGKKCGWQKPAGQLRISSYESNSKRPPFESVLLLAKALQACPCWLQFGIGNQKKKVNAKSIDK